VSRTDRGIAAEQSDEFDVIHIFDVRPAGGGEASLRGISRSSAVDADRRQGRDGRRPVNTARH